MKGESINRPIGRISPIGRIGRSHRTPLATAVWLLASVLCATPVHALSRRPAEAPPVAAEPPAATSHFEGVELVGEDADGTLWKLHAEEGWGREGERTGTLRGVRATLHQGEQDLLLEAAQATVDEGRAFHLSQGVELRWGEFLVQVEQASYLLTRGVVVSDQPTQFTGPGLRLSGVGIEVEVATRVVRIAAQVRARLGEEAR